MLVFIFPLVSVFAQSDLDVYVDNIVNLLIDAKSEYSEGNVDEAKRLAMKAYIDNYEYLEDPIDAYDEELNKDLELTLREELQQKMRNGESSVAVNQLIDEILTKLKTATEITPELSQIELNDIITPSSNSQESHVEEGGGCLIATATYGSELAPQVQQLREIRDNKLLKTNSGTFFISLFHQFYYSFSPVIADYERENPMFKEGVKVLITPLISSLSILNHVDINSEESVLGYGISLILLNIGMYFVAPVVLIFSIKNKFSS